MSVGLGHADDVRSPFMLPMKAAYRLLVDECGGVEPVAAFLGVHKQRVSEWCSTSHSVGPTAHQVVRLETWIGCPIVTRAQAAALKLTLVDDHAAPIALCPTSLGMAAKEHGEALAALGGLQAGLRGACEQAAIKEIDEAVEWLTGLKRSLVARSTEERKAQ